MGPKQVYSESKQEWVNGTMWDWDAGVMIDRGAR